MDLTTRYLGLTLRNPLIASASPLSGDIATIRQLEDAGAGAIVLPSLFEEQIREEERLIEVLTNVGNDSNPEAGSVLSRGDAGTIPAPRATLTWLPGHAPRSISQSSPA